MPNDVATKTIAEMFSQAGGDRLNPTDRDKLLLGVLTFADRCSMCSAPTYETDFPWTHGKRICIQCLVNEVAEFEDSERIADLEYDVDELRRENESLENDLASSEDERKKLQDRVNELRDADIEDLQEQVKRMTANNADLANKIRKMETTIEEKDGLIVAISEECDELRARVDAFDDDSQALKNQNRRLLLDMKELRKRNGNK